MVSKASEDLPDPERPVMTTSRSRGMSTSTFLRLCSRAPRTEMDFCINDPKVRHLAMARRGDRRKRQVRSSLSSDSVPIRTGTNREHVLLCLQAQNRRGQVGQAGGARQYRRLIWNFRQRRDGDGGQRQQGDPGGQSGARPGSPAADLRGSGGQSLDRDLGILARQGLGRAQGEDRVAPGGDLQREYRQGGGAISEEGLQGLSRGAAADPQIQRQR